MVHSALAGSTNAMIHLVAMARRAGITVTLDDFDDFAQAVPVIANLRPSGAWLMEDFHIAGGIRALLSRLDAAAPPRRAHRRRRHARARRSPDAEVFDDDVIRPLDKPIAASGGTAILYGNIAPDGCVIKPPAAEPRLLKHAGPALVFDNYDAMTEAVNDLDLDVTPDHIMVLRNAGPIGGPGMPEWGMLPIPKKLLQQGVRDMLRISDARMSGTSYGACILHVSPEAHMGGPLAAVRTGDIITVDVANALDPAAVERRGDRRAPEDLVAAPARTIRAATTACSPSTCGRPTRAATSIFWKAPAPAGAGDPLESLAERRGRAPVSSPAGTARERGGEEGGSSTATGREATLCGFQTERLRRKVMVLDSLPLR